MREILFRGKSIYADEWAYGSLVKHRGGCRIEDYDRIVPYLYEVDPTTIGQYTGLKDKNGTKIFEGDICKWRFKRVWSTEYHVAEVIFRQEKCGWRLNTNGDTDKMRDDIEYEVIGNIHDKEEK